MTQSSSQRLFIHIYCSSICIAFGSILCQYNYFILYKDGKIFLPYTDRLHYYIGLFGLRKD